jgi:hypothetical protein
VEHLVASRNTELGFTPLNYTSVASCQYGLKVVYTLHEIGVYLSGLEKLIKTISIKSEKNF